MVATTYTTTFESKTVTATTGGASGDVLYTVPSNHDFTIDYLGVANGGNSSSKITVEIFHADDGTYHYLTNEHQIAGHDTYHLLNADRIHLHAGDKVIVSKENSGDTFDVSLSGRQFFNPNKT
jgi:hypothetical protein